MVHSFSFLSFGFWGAAAGFAKWYGIEKRCYNFESPGVCWLAKVLICSILWLYTILILIETIL